MIRSALAALALTAALPSTASAATYVIGNSNQVLGYGVAGSSFTPFTVGSNCFAPGVYCLTNGTDQFPVIGQNNNTTPTPFLTTILVPGSSLFLHPGDSNSQDAILNFIAPTSSTYKFNGSFIRYDITKSPDGGPSNTGVATSIFRMPVVGTATNLYSGIVAPTAYLASSAFSGTTYLKAGDVLSFAVNRNGNVDTSYYYDATGLVGSISAVPEPATWAMMILGMGAVGGFMRRKKSAARPTFA